MEYCNHEIKEEDDKFFVVLTCRNGKREIQVTNLQAGKKLITKFNKSILSDEEFVSGLDARLYTVNELEVCFFE